MLVSDNSTESYAIFTYMCGELNWLSHHPATIGFSADRHFYSNHILSKSRTVNDIACLHQQESIWSNLVYKLSISKYFLNTDLMVYMLVQFQPYETCINFFFFLYKQ